MINNPFSIQVSVTDTAVKANVGAMSERVHRNMLRAVTKEALMLEQHVKRDKLLGQVLKRQTGALGQSIHNEVIDEPAEITGRVYSAGVKYAGLHEFGGTFERLVTKAWGRLVKNPHQVKFTYPDRSYLRSALKDNRERIIDALKQAQSEGTKI